MASSVDRPRALGVAVFFLAGAAAASTSSAEPLPLTSSSTYPASVFAPFLRHDGRDESAGDATRQSSQLPAHLRRQVVDYPIGQPPGTIVIDTANTYLYLALGPGKALRYGIGVGREGFTWSGVQTVSRMAEWPDWVPPPEMIGRQPYLPRFMAGGPGNPLGARALYLGETAYRIHGTSDPSSIGRHVSSGCIRMTNEDVIDLYGRVKPGSKVIVLPAGSRRTPSVQASTRVAPAAVVNANSDAGFAFGIH